MNPKHARVRAVRRLLEETEAGRREHQYSIGLRAMKFLDEVKLSRKRIQEPVQRGRWRHRPCGGVHKNEINHVWKRRTHKRTTRSDNTSVDTLALARKCANNEQSIMGRSHLGVSRIKANCDEDCDQEQSTEFAYLAIAGKL